MVQKTNSEATVYSKFLKYCFSPKKHWPNCKISSKSGAFGQTVNEVLLVHIRQYICRSSSLLAFSCREDYSPAWVLDSQLMSESKVTPEKFSETSTAFEIEFITQFRIQWPAICFASHIHISCYFSHAPFSFPLPNLTLHGYCETSCAHFGGSYMVDIHDITMEH